MRVIKVLLTLQERFILVRFFGGFCIGLVGTQIGLWFGMLLHLSRSRELVLCFVIMIIGLIVQSFF